MWKYPIKSDKSGYVSLKEAYQWCNQSFFDGFTAALCETPEEFEALEVADRIARTQKGRYSDSLWDMMSLLSFVYDTGRVQGMREERAKRKERYNG